jgi:putative FmdB family regulatory protein
VARITGWFRTRAHLAGTMHPMPLYEYRCRTCDERFELRRPMSDAASPATCPDGHDDTVRMLSMFATTGSAAVGTPSPVRGGCCGGACGCAN